MCDTHTHTHTLAHMHKHITRFKHACMHTLTTCLKTYTTHTHTHTFLGANQGHKQATEGTHKATQACHTLYTMTAICFYNVNFSCSVNRPMRIEYALGESTLNLISNTDTVSDGTATDQDLVQISGDQEPVEPERAPARLSAAEDEDLISSCGSHDNPELNKTDSHAPWTKLRKLDPQNAH